MLMMAFGAFLSLSIRSARLSFQSRGDKSGGGEKRFYRQLIAKADKRFDGHLALLKKRKN
jgi:hypothetical protein